MTPAARIATAIELLDEIFAGVPAEKCLTGWGRRNRFAGSKDRAAVRDHVFDGLRQRASAAQAGGSADGRGVMIGVLRLSGVDPESMFTGEGYAASVLSDEERDVQTDDVRPLDVPAWLVDPLRDSLADEFDTTMDAIRARAPVSLRVNLRKASISEAQAQLREDGVETVPLSLADTALQVVQGPRRVAQSAAYRDGLVELQDASSQAAVASLSLRNNMKIMDYCAGGGGKTLAMAALCDGQYFAHDANPVRLRDLPARAERAGISVQTLEDASSEAPYDLVFCDVPCSGSGTWRRTPDAKWRFTQEDLSELTDLQAEILTKAAGLVAQNGTLVYATCSLLQAENENQLAQFVKTHGDWTVIASRRYPMNSDGDGFFVAQFRRESA
ncbi:Ribosomal RNA small subunit methyltransferase B [Shimia sp. SK013]|uniref:RsmB/NOP family class I SAM-dependent RNA methyltransferase n=1 Tax=Shimia sp. SK013 TaxID=1389006 RepID=UPI0006B4DCFC|nr:RsmB/NOP family class I SAM-dependent RNA methyltransferase [Shimia sp. SK013]KPA22513.1 Ribosomal RNA small subunit methyltransferase B [Shimia sp. SK013]